MFGITCFVAWCFVLLGVARSAFISPHVASRLHLVDVARYEACPFHAHHSHSFACHIADPSKTERIIQATKTHFLHGRAVFPMLSGQNILFAGDSLVRNQFNSLACLLWETDTTITQNDIIADGEKIILGIISKLYNFELHFVFTGNILDLNEVDLGKLYSMHHLKLYGLLRKVIHGHKKDVEKPTTLLISAGHHFDMSKYHKPPPPPAHQPVIDLDLYRYAVERINKQLHDISKMRIIWRAVPPRHYVHGDWNTGGRCDSLAPCPDDFISHEVSVYESNYWKATVLSDIVRNVSQSHGFEYLDILPYSLNRCDGMVGATPIGARAEGTVDCSHYCVPGVPDAWNVEFVKLLLGDKFRLHQNLTMH